MFRPMITFAAAVAFSIAPLAFAGGVDRECIPDPLPKASAPHVDVEALFAKVANMEVVDPHTAPMAAMEMVLARIGPDGKLVTACVDNAEAARRFLDAPIERVGTAKRDQ